MNEKTPFKSLEILKNSYIAENEWNELNEIIKGEKPPKRKILENVFFDIDENLIIIENGTGEISRFATQNVKEYDNNIFEKNKARFKTGIGTENSLDILLKIGFETSLSGNENINYRLKEYLYIAFEPIIFTPKIMVTAQKGNKELFEYLEKFNYSKQDIILSFGEFTDCLIIYKFEPIYDKICPF